MLNFYKLLVVIIRTKEETSVPDLNSKYIYKLIANNPDKDSGVHAVNLFLF